MQVPAGGGPGEAGRSCGVQRCEWQLVGRLGDAGGGRRELWHSDVRVAAGGGAWVMLEGAVGFGGSSGSRWGALVTLEAVGGSCGIRRFEWQQVGGLGDAGGSRSELWNSEVRLAAGGQAW